MRGGAFAGGDLMKDLLFVLLTVALFVLAIAYTRACEKV